MSTITTIEIKHTLLVSDELIDYIKESDGTRYWVYEEDSSVTKNSNGDTTVTFNGQRYTYDKETCLKGIKLWVENGGDWAMLSDCGTDHFDHDNIWQYGFFGELVYG
jgi:hypothetical protein